MVIMPRLLRGWIHVPLLVILMAAVSTILHSRMPAMFQEDSATVMSAAINMETAVLISMIFNAQVVSVSDEPCAAH